MCGYMIERNSERLIHENHGVVRLLNEGIGGGTCSCGMLITADESSTLGREYQESEWHTLCHLRVRR